MAAVAGFLCDGFDMYNGMGAGGASSAGVASRWNVNSSGDWSIVSGRFGGQGLQCSNSAGSCTLTFASNYTSFAIGMACVIGAGSQNANQQLFGVYLNGLNQVYMALTTGGGLNIYNGNNTLLASSGAGALPNYTAYHYFEIAGTISSSAGTVFGYIDGIQVCTASSVNTGFNGSSINEIAFGVLNGANANWQFDDLYFNPGSALGPMRIATLYPAANVSGQVNWTPLTGSNFSEVNETHCDGDTSYNSAGNVGTSDLYTFGSLPSTPATIFAVSPVCFARSTDANPRQLNLQLTSGGTNELGSNVAYGATSYIRSQRYDFVDPNTSAGWTAAAVNALEGGPYVAV